ncbi:rubredoxin [Geomonas sp. Red875]|uniref:Rubredoxin n=2 Tax=Geomesophilobacter sediminis TaxID=2798584 RepID=A0A8J7LXY3_9BACT|nr:rubredoxin [Geomesophilobacter sediminis]
MQRWRCSICSHIYDPAEGDAANEVPPGISFEDLLEEWTCPICNAAKRFFEPL